MDEETQKTPTTQVLEMLKAFVSDQAAIAAATTTEQNERFREAEDGANARHEKSLALGREDMELRVKVLEESLQISRESLALLREIRDMVAAHIGPAETLGF